jgi:hypothetical protein
LAVVDPVRLLIYGVGQKLARKNVYTKNAGGFTGGLVFHPIPPPCLGGWVVQSGPGRFCSKTPFFEDFQYFQGFSDLQMTSASLQTSPASSFLSVASLRTLSASVSALPATLRTSWTRLRTRLANLRASPASVR